MHKISWKKLFAHILSLNLILDPVYDKSSSATWQATGDSLQTRVVQRHVDINSFTTQHYAFLTGQDRIGALGIAYVGSPCFQKSSGEFMNRI